MKNKPFINIEELEYTTQQHNDKFAARHAPIAPLIGARVLWASGQSIE
jgi:hypothetical protein